MVPESLFAKLAWRFLGQRPRPYWVNLAITGTTYCGGVVEVPMDLFNEEQ